MASTAVMSVLGFVFWIFVAHLYAPADIGIASALISLSTLISNFSLLGLNAGIIRFLPGSKQPSGDINASAIAVGLVTTVVASIFVLFGSHFTAHLTLLDNPWHKLLFVALMSAVSLNSLTDAVFIANRRGEYHTIGYGTFGIVKLVLPLLFIPFGATGVFGAYILAMLASLLVSYYLMRRGCDYRLFTKPTWALLKNMRRYAFHNYLGAIIASLPAQLMPLFIIRQINAPAAAFFSMAWTMVNLLYIVPSATTQSLMAETVHDGEQRASHLKRTIRLLALLLIPAVALAVVVSPHLLALFGAQYRLNGTAIFQILSLATFFVAITAVGITILNIERRTWGVVAVQASSTVATGAAA
ncbi:MAG TPA: oligosaccharide flippase family protein, partial [Candidatus Saccharimonadales bacterium]|nr:oligosaccharide flippase family protein [Candidatus Saccharimonadales bacterium]